MAVDDGGTVRDIVSEETDRAPNRYATHALLAVLATVFLACVMNELHIFTVHRGMMWLCFILSAAAFVLVEFLSKNESRVADLRSKYIIMLATILLTMAVTITLNINVTLLFVLPMLLATQYRSMKLSFMAVIGSALCSILSPVLSWLAGTWDLNIMTGYIETFCHVTLGEISGPSMSAGEGLLRVLLYCSLPMFMVVLLFGTIILAITRTSIMGLKSRVKVTELSEELNRELRHIHALQDRFIYTMADIVENRDASTGIHVKRTSFIVDAMLDAIRAAGEISVTDAFCADMTKAAPLHDIGKIAVPDAILQKPGILTEEERAVMKTHAAKGAEIIRGTLTGLEDEAFIDIAANLAMYHHEWYDGSGYPRGLKGGDIPLEARVMAIADVYDALVSNRCYKRPIPHEIAWGIVESLMGRQFDPGLEKYFQAVKEKIKQFYTE